LIYGYPNISIPQQESNNREPSSHLISPKTHFNDRQRAKQPLAYNNPLIITPRIKFLSVISRHIKPRNYLTYLVVAESSFAPRMPKPSNVSDRLLDCLVVAEHESEGSQSQTFSYQSLPPPRPPCQHPFLKLTPPSPSPQAYQLL
jgi:hypothetical protein